MKGLFLALAMAAAGWTAAAQGIPPVALGEEPSELVPEEVRDVVVGLLDPPGGAADDALTTDDPEIEEGALSLRLDPLTLAGLRNEIAGWEELLVAAVERLSEAELELFDLNAAEEDAAEAAEAAGDGTVGQTAESGDAAAEADGMSPEEAALVERISELRSERTARADRLRLVLNAFEAKGGDPAETAELRAYMAEVGGVTVDTRDFRTAMLTLREWAVAEDGGQRVLREVATIAGATVAGAAAGWLLSLVVDRGLRSTDLSSRLMRRFLRRWMARVGALVGLLMGLSALGTNMTPILAALGAAGFILAFALQSTISNFASGLLILFQRPFDAGDEVEAAGVTGEVERVSLFSTHLSTAENRKVIVPNNKIWEDVIVNSTGTETRRLAIEVEVATADHSLDEAEATLLRLMKDHEGVLDDPAPEIKLSALTGEEMTFLCWPWVRTEDKDKVRWELVARFGRELTVSKGVTKSGAA